MDKKAFGKRIKKFRKAKNLTQEVLAEKADLCAPYISGIERGIKMPSLATAVKLAGGLQITLDQLLGASQPVNKEAFYAETQELLANSTFLEQQVIIDVANALKQSLREQGIVQ